METIGLRRQRTFTRAPVYATPPWQYIATKCPRPILGLEPTICGAIGRRRTMIHGTVFLDPLWRRNAIQSHINSSDSAVGSTWVLAPPSRDLDRHSPHVGCSAARSQTRHDNLIVKETACAQNDQAFICHAYVYHVVCSPLASKLDGSGGCRGYVRYLASLRNGAEISGRGGPCASGCGFEDAGPERLRRWPANGGMA